MTKRSSAAARNAEILHSIVRSYIQTGEPVASRTVSKRRNDGLSAASIRNVMADLCEEGYLAQPHTSAGRIPTQKAFKSYVQSLARARVLAEELHRLKTELGQLATMEARVERSSHMLTEMTRSVGIAVAIPTSSQLLDQIELISLAPNRVLMVVITRDRMVRNRVITLDEPATQVDLHSIRNYVNQHFGGWMLSRIHVELKRRLDQESAAYDASLRKLTQLYEKGLLDVGLLPEIHMDGASYLIGLDLHLTQERLRDLFRTLEEKKRILQLLDRFLEQPTGELQVQIGLADAYPNMRELSLIGISVTMSDGLSAKIAVLGPMRMNYERVISAVVHMGHAFQSLSS
jgi:heat-inducible transcriptional repressor